MQVSSALVAMHYRPSDAWLTTFVSEVMLFCRRSKDVLCFIMSAVFHICQLCFVNVSCVSYIFSDVLCFIMSAVSHIRQLCFIYVFRCAAFHNVSCLVAVRYRSLPWLGGKNSRHFGPVCSFSLVDAGSVLLPA